MRSPFLVRASRAHAVEHVGPGLCARRRNVGVVGHGALDQAVHQAVKERLDVQIDDPVEVPAALPRHPYRVERRLPGRQPYVLGYSPSHGKWDSRFREIKVKVKRPGVAVRHRKGYLALPLPQQDKAKTDRGLSDALRSPLEATGIALTARVHRIEAQDGLEVNVAIQVEPRSVTLEKKGDIWEGSFALVIAQSAAEGKLFKSVDSNVDLRRTSELRERMLKQGPVWSTRRSR